MILSHVGPQSPGDLTAHEAACLSLLPSGPDEVRKTSLRKTQALQPDLKKNICFFLFLKIDKKMAESERFELSVQYYRTHAFQACSFNHSDNSPQCSTIRSYSVLLPCRVIAACNDIYLTISNLSCQHPFLFFHRKISAEQSAEILCITR